MEGNPMNSDKRKQVIKELVNLIHTSCIQTFKKKLESTEAEECCVDGNLPDEMPSEAGTTPCATGKLLSEIGTMPDETGKMPCEISTMPSEAGKMPSTIVVRKNIKITIVTNAKDFHETIFASNKKLMQNVRSELVKKKRESSSSFENECYETDFVDRGDRPDSDEYSMPDKFQFLLCSSPNKTTYINSHDEINIIDEDGQYYQYEEFWRLFLNDPYASIKNSPFCAFYKCTDRRNAMLAIKDFLERKAKKTTEAVFIFLGHGSENGFTFINDSEDWPLDNILELIWDEFAHTREESNLPACVKVVFACCYGHNHSFEKNSQLYQVISFTDAQSPEILILYDLDESNQIRQSSHDGLYQAAAIFQEKLNPLLNRTEELMDTTDE